MCTGTLSGVCVCVWRVSAVLCCVLSDVSMNQDINFRYNFRWLVHGLVDNFPHSCISDAIGNHEGGKRNYNPMLFDGQSSLVRLQPHRSTCLPNARRLADIW